jgi:ABC-2 type transport system permease protein
MLPLKILFSIYSARLGKDFSLPLWSQIFSHIGSLCFFTLHVLSFRLLISKFIFPGWSTSDLWVLLFTFEAFTYLAFFLFWKGFTHTIRDVNSGAFDLIITKPASSILITIFRGGGLHNLTCAILGLIFLFSHVAISNLTINVLSILAYFFTLGLSLFTFLNLSLCFISLTFRFGKATGLAGIGFQAQEIYKYPSQIYSSSNLHFVFILIFLSLFTTFPTSLLIGKPLSLTFIAIYFGLSLILFFLSRLMWRHSLRHYSSASS